MFNAMALIHYEEMIERGVLPAELNDMPNYQPAAKPHLTIRRQPKKQAAPEKEPWLKSRPIRA